MSFYKVGRNIIYEASLTKELRTPIFGGCDAPLEPSYCSVSCGETVYTVNAYTVVAKREIEHIQKETGLPIPQTILVALSSYYNDFTDGWHDLTNVKKVFELNLAEDDVRKLNDIEYKVNFG